MKLVQDDYGCVLPDGERINTQIFLDFYLEDALYRHRKRKQEVLHKAQSFKSFMIIPAACQLVFTHMKEVIVVDRTHMISNYSVMLLVAVGIDVNNNTLPLAWQYSLSENKAYWEDFFRNFSNSWSISQARMP